MMATNMAGHENLSGPQTVSTRAQEIAGCPNLNGDASAFWTDFEPLDLSFRNPVTPTREDMEHERVNRFALAKVITDELADRLPHMREKYPPYGLPEFYRAGSRPRTITELTPEYGHSDPLQGFLTSLNRAYSTKAIVHFFDEMRDMYGDPQYKDAIEALSVQRTPNYHINTGSADEEAVDRVLPPVENARDTILGMFNVLPTVFENQFGLRPSHDEVIAILRASKRLPVLPSLLDMGQLQSFIIGTTEEPHVPATLYGYALKPELFVIGETKNGNNGLVMDYAGGIGTIAIQKYELDFGEFGDVIYPTVTVDETSTPNTLDELKLDRTTLTCPARRFIAAMWTDMVDIADTAKFFEK